MFTREKQEMKRVPMMPVRDMVIFPQQMTPFIVGREASVRALEEALAGDKKIFLSTQHDASVDDPKPEEIYAVGTRAGALDCHGRRILPRHGSPAGRARRAISASRSDRPEDHRPVRAIHQAFAEPELRHDDRGRARG